MNLVGTRHYYIYSIHCRAPMANTIAACVGSKDVQSMVACPHTIGKRVTGSLLKFNRKEMQEALRYIYSIAFEANNLITRSS